MDHGDWAVSVHVRPIPPRSQTYSAQLLRSGRVYLAKAGVTYVNIAPPRVTAEVRIGDAVPPPTRRRGLPHNDFTTSTTE